MIRHRLIYLSALSLATGSLAFAQTNANKSGFEQETRHNLEHILKTAQKDGLLGKEDAQTSKAEPKFALSACPPAWFDLNSVKTDETVIEAQKLRLLAKQDLASGFSMEALRQLDDQKDGEARILSAMARTLDFISTDEDSKLFASCGDKGRLWFMSAQAGQGVISDTPLQVELSDIYKVQTLPPNLRRHVFSLIGLYSAETGQTAMTQYILRDLAPETLKNSFDLSRGDIVTYTVALHRLARSEGEDMLLLKRVAQHDGLFRGRALARLDELRQNGKKAYAQMDRDLAGLGDIEADNSAVTEAITARLISEIGTQDTISLIKEARLRFSPASEAYTQVSRAISNHNHVGLQNTDESQRVESLNIFLTEPEFFLSVSENSDHFRDAFEVARDLGVSEVMTAMIKTQEGEDWSGYLALTEFDAMLEAGNLDSARRVLDGISNKTDYVNQYAQAAILLDNAAHIKTLTQPPLSKFLSKDTQNALAWREKNWAYLKQVDGPQSSDTDAATQSVLEIMTTPYSAKVSAKKSTMETLSEQTSHDISRIRKFLSHG